jgi:nicotinamidase-related amidase
VALLLIDVINAFEFRGSGPLIRASERASGNIERLATRARAAKVPVIYVNDNFGQWRSDFAATVKACTAKDSAGRAVSRRLWPQPGDFFVLKPQHSGFYSTPLQLLLSELGAHTLVLCGFATNLCVVFTANDAHMLGYHLTVPSDCTAANTPALRRVALEHVRVALSGDTRRSRDVRFATLTRRAKKPRSQGLRG